MSFSHLFEKPTENVYPVFDASLLNKKIATLAASLHDVVIALSHNISGPVFVDGGHYPLEQAGDYILHKPNSSTIMAFELALLLLKSYAEKEKPLPFAFLFNDMGVNPQARDFLKKNPLLHPVYMEKIRQHGLLIDTLPDFFFESRLRNRADRLILKQGLISGVVKMKDNMLFAPGMSDDRNEPFFGNFLGYLSSENNHVIVPFCRAIMAQKLHDTNKVKGTTIINVLTENEYKCLGEFARTYHVTGGRKTIINILLSPYELTPSGVSSYNNGRCVCSSKVLLLQNNLNTFVQIQKYEVKQAT